MDKLEKKWHHFVNFFFVFCVIGWLYEVVWEFAIGHGFVNRGFLHGPYLPIYGFGVLILYFVLRKFIKKEIKVGKLNVTPILIFLLIMVIVSVVEYIGSVFLEKCFGLTLWDYSYDALNLNGRISLRNSTLLSLGAMLMLYFVLHLLEKIFEKVSAKTSIILASLIILVMGIDLIIKII